MVPTRVRNPVRFYVTPDAKYVKIYQSDFTKNQFPLELLGGSHVDFAKLLFVFADQCEGKNYKLYADEFNKLDETVSKIGPFWGEENFLESQDFRNFSAGFKFVLGWMQSEGAIDRVEYVRSAYKELINEANKETTATITLAEDPSQNKKLFDEIKKEVQALHKKSPQKDYKLVVETKVDPAIGGGYIIEVCNQLFNKSAAAEAETAALQKASASQVDWTALPPAAPRPSASAPDTLVRLLGPVVDDLSVVDKVELKYGA